MDDRSWLRHRRHCQTAAPGQGKHGFHRTILLGIAGSFLAGIVGQALGWYQAGEGAGFIASVVVAIILLVIYGKVRGSPPST